MQIPVEVSFRNMDRSEYLEADVLHNVGKLEEFFDRITRCRVVVEAPHRSHHQGNLYRVRIQLGVPHRELVADRESHDRHEHEDPYVAVRDAFNAMRRQLEDYVRELRHDTKPHEVPPHGRVTKILYPEGPDFPERACGFIETPDGREVYFHANSLVDGDFQELDIGTEVRFVEEAGEKGPQASSVRMMGQHHHLVD